MSESASAVARDSWWRSIVGRLGRTRVGRYFAQRFRNVSRSEACGYAVWGSMGLVIAFPELWAAFEGSDSRWPTISSTVGHLGDRWPIVALAPVALLAGWATSYSASGRPCSSYRRICKAWGEPRKVDSPKLRSTRPIWSAARISR
jgi:hypothetical protein